MKLKVIVRNFLRALILPLKEIDFVLPEKGTILDLGCGEGVITRYLAQKKDRLVIGIDIDKKRLPRSSPKNLKFKAADVRIFKMDNADAIVLSDVLHHINFHDQDTLLNKISKSLNKGKILVIKEVDTHEFLRSKLSRFWDFIFYPKEKVYFSNAKDFKKKLENIGFGVQILRPVLFFPGSGILYICTKN